MLATTDLIHRPTMDAIDGRSCSMRCLGPGLLNKKPHKRLLNLRVSLCFQEQNSRSIFQNLCDNSLRRSLHFTAPQPAAVCVYPFIPSPRCHRHAPASTLGATGCQRLNDPVVALRVGWTMAAPTEMTTAMMATLERRALPLSGAETRAQTPAPGRPPR